jgi:hypothetical protein
LRKRLRSSSPGEILQIATAVLALLATIAAAIAAIYTYRLGQETEERLSSAVVEVYVSREARVYLADIEHFGPVPVPPDSMLTVDLGLTVRNLGGVTAVISDLDPLIPGDPGCTASLASSEDPASENDPGKRRLPRLVEPGAAKVVRFRREYRLSTLEQSCLDSTVEQVRARASPQTTVEALLRGAMYDFFGVRVTFGGDKTLESEPGKTGRRRV